MPSQMMNPFLGWIVDDVVLPDARIRQGDLIKFDGAVDTLRKLAIVVTADCDLEQKKHARTLTLVPVVPATTIIENYLLLDDCEKKKNLIEDFVFKGFSINLDQDSIVQHALLREKMKATVSDPSSPLTVAAEFILHDTNRLAFSAYIDLMREMNIKAKKIDSFKDQMRKRGDLLVLPEADALGIKGHVAWVRQLWQTSASDIALRTSEVAMRSGERIARLDSPFRYRLTQLIAQVFSDIGLPDMPDSIDEILDEAFR